MKTGGLSVRAAIGCYCGGDSETWLDGNQVGGTQRTGHCDGQSLVSEAHLLVPAHARIRLRSTATRMYTRHHPTIVIELSVCLRWSLRPPDGTPGPTAAVGLLDLGLGYGYG